MKYGASASYADAFAIPDGLIEVFRFGNAVNGANSGKEIGSGLVRMINPNLDAELPVLLTLLGNSGHAIVADGYGYDLSAQNQTLYHHLNMGWAGTNDLWYNLPDAGNYNAVVACVYNIFTEGQGEIVSGRVTDASDQPIAGAYRPSETPEQHIRGDHQRQRHLRSGQTPLRQHVHCRGPEIRVRVPAADSLDRGVPRLESHVGQPMGRGFHRHANGRFRRGQRRGFRGFRVPGERTVELSDVAAFVATVGSQALLHRALEFSPANELQNLLLLPFTYNIKI